MQADYGQAPAVYVIDAPVANTEYSLELPRPVKAIRIQARDSTDVRLAFEAGKVAGSTDPYHTVKGGNPYEEKNLFWNKAIIYVATGSASKKVEVLVWE